MRLIDADARVTVQRFDEEHEEYDHTEMSVEEALDFATDEGCPPVVDAAPVVHGRWIYKERHRKSYRQYTGYDAVGDIHTVMVLEETDGKEPYCSECGAQAAESYMDFCPHCGATMDAPTCGPDYCEIGGGDDADG